MQRETLLQIGLSEEQANNVLELHAGALKEYVPRDAFNEAMAQNKAEAERAAKELSAHKIDTAITLHLSNAGVKSPKLMKQLLDLSKISMEGETLTGIQEQLGELRETDAYLFHSDRDRLSGREPMSGSGGGSSNELRNNPFKKETLNLTEQSKLMRENPELAKRLQAAAGAQ